MLLFVSCDVFTDKFMKYMSIYKRELPNQISGDMLLLHDYNVDIFITFAIFMCEYKPGICFTLALWVELFLLLVRYWSFTIHGAQL